MLRRRKLKSPFFTDTVKFVHAATPIKESPVLKGHLFLVLTQKISCELNLF